MTDDNDLTAILAANRVRALSQMARASIPVAEREDMWQDVCSDILKRRAQGILFMDERLPGLVRTIVFRRIADRRRKKQRSVEMCFGRTNDLLSSLPGPDTSSARRIAEIHVLCSPTERELLSLRLEGYSASDIAKSLGVSPADVNRRFNRLKIRLRDLLAKRREN